MAARAQAAALWFTVLTCLVLASLAVSSNGESFVAYRQDLENNRQYCEAEGKAEERQNAKECQSFLYRTFDDPVAFFTAALWFATIALFVATFGLFLFAARQTGAAREAAAAAKVSADTALASVRISADQATIMDKQREIAAEQAAIQRTLATIEGPVLFVHTVEPAEFKPFEGAGPDGRPCIQPFTRIHFANYGRTPAILLGIDYAVRITRGGIPSTPTYSPYMHRMDRRQIVESGQEKGDSVDLRGEPMPEEDVANIRLTRPAFYVFGRLVYRDPFGGRAETSFGWLLTRLGFTPQPVRPAAYNQRKTYGPDDKDAPHGHYES